MARSRPHGQCDVAVDGVKAIYAFEAAFDGKRPYNLITIDIMMPHMDGFEVLTAIRRFEKTHGVNDHDHVKIIVTTVLGEAVHVREAFLQGCDAYLVKPIKKSKLRQEIEKLGLVLSEATDEN